MSTTGGFSRMPPLGSNEVDSVSITLVRDWINQSLPNRLTYSEWRQQAFLSPDSAKGQPGADPDGDGSSNEAEFIAGTLVTNGGSFFRPAVRLSGAAVSLDFTIPENRSVQVETSDDLTNWSLWDIPANDGIPLSGGATTFSGPAPASNQYYRLRISDR